MVKNAGLGPLGNISENEHGVKVETENALTNAIDRFKGEVNKLETAQKEVGAAVSALESWVSLGEKALELAGPLIDKKLSKPPAGADMKPSWSEQITGKIADVSSILVELNKLKPGP